jgi:hypothetical protein
LVNYTISTFNYRVINIMDHCRKLVLLPADVEKNVNLNTSNNLNNMIKVILQIAGVNGYNKNLEISDNMGDFITNSNIEQLIKNLYEPQPIIEKRYIDILFNALIKPELIKNNSAIIALKERYSKANKAVTISSLSSQNETYKRKNTKKVSKINTKKAKNHINWEFI